MYIAIICWTGLHFGGDKNCNTLLEHTEDICGFNDVSKCNFYLKIQFLPHRWNTSPVWRPSVNVYRETTALYYKNCMENTNMLQAENVELLRV
jgi:hypothetical protein